MPLSSIFKSLSEWDAQLLLERHEWNWAERYQQMPGVVWLDVAATTPTGCRKCRRGAQECECQKLCMWLGSASKHEPGPGRVWKIVCQRTRKVLRWEEFSGWEKDSLEGLRAALRLKRYGTGVLWRQRKSWEATKKDYARNGSSCSYFMSVHKIPWAFLG